MTEAAYVPQALLPWSMPWTQYKPNDITPPELQPETIAKNGTPHWADATTDPTEIDYTPRQATALVPFEVVGGLPLNPSGRTGKTGRILGLWGENQAADPILIADSDTGPRVLLIRRDDCQQWAIPGGMVDPGETAPAALIRELREETGVNLAGLEPEILARTYIDDPRNSDLAWICSTVALYRLPALVEATAGSDAEDALWWPIDSMTALQNALKEADAELYSAHEPILNTAIDQLAYGISPS